MGGGPFDLVFKRMSLYRSVLQKASTPLSVLFKVTLRDKELPHRLDDMFSAPKKCRPRRSRNTEALPHEAIVVQSIRDHEDWFASWPPRFSGFCMYGVAQTFRMGRSLIETDIHDEIHVRPDAEPAAFHDGVGPLIVPC